MKQFRRVEPTIVESIGGQYKRQIVVKTFQTEDDQLHEFTTYGAEGKRAGAVIAVTKDKKIVTMYQFRPAPERWMYDLPGGGINEGEDPQVGIIRELKEETGYVPGHVEFLGELDARDAYMNGHWYYYLATDCALSETGRQLDIEEEEQGAEVRLITVSELVENAKRGDMTDPVAVLLAYEKLQSIGG